MAFGAGVTVDAADEATATIEWVNGILKDERDIVIEADPLEATSFTTGGIRFANVCYASGLSTNVMYGRGRATRRHGWRRSSTAPRHIAAGDDPRPG